MKLSTLHNESLTYTVACLHLVVNERIHERAELSTEQKFWSFEQRVDSD